MISKELFDTPIFDQYPSIKSQEELIEWALLFLSGGNKMSTHRYDSGSEKSYSLSTFDGAYLFSSYFNEDEYFRAFDSEVNLNLLDIKPKDLNFKFFFIPDKGNVGNDSTIYLEKFSYVPFNQRRGLKFKNRHVLKNRIAILHSNEKWYTQERYLSMYYQSFINYNSKIRMEMERLKNDAFKKNEGKGLKKSELKQTINDLSEEYFKEIFKIDPHFKFDMLLLETGRPDLNYDNPYNSSTIYCERFNMWISVSLTNYYNWHVYIKEAGSLVGFQMPFVFDNLNELFSLREMPKTRLGRNKAIIHFVKEHYRRLKIKDVTGMEIGQKEIWIKKFLRGETKFKWHGTEVSIIPSGYDLKRIKTTKKFANSKFNN